MKRTASGASLLLMELLIAIGLFAVVAAVCLRIFAAAGVSADRSRELNRAVLAAQSAAECYKSAGGRLDDAALLLGGETGADALHCDYDENWQQTQAGVYRLTLSSRPGTDGLCRAAIVVEQVEEGRVVYTLSVTALPQVTP